MEADLLLAATYGGDTRAFESLVRSQAGRLHHIARRVTGDASLADDVLQETFLRILRVPPAARPSRAAESWLARVTVRVALNVLESESARRRREERYAEKRSREMKDRATIGAASPHDLEGPVAEALASLSPDTRAALWLHVVEGEGVREVAACLDCSRSAVSWRVRAGLEALRRCLARSGFALAGVSALGDALRGSEIPAPESLVRRMVEAGTAAMTADAASTMEPDALDAALAAPVRFLPSFFGIGAAAVVVIIIVVMVAFGWRLFRPESDRGVQAVRPVAAAPGVPPAKGAQKPKSAEMPIPPAPAAPAKEPAIVTGVILDEKKEPIPSADVYLALHPPREDDKGMDVWQGYFFRPDYYRRSRFFETKTDDGGRYVFKGVPEAGGTSLWPFKEGYSGAVAWPEGALVLGEGFTLTGTVTAADGSPVADAIVSVCQTWSATDHIFYGSGLSPTDASGRFRVPLGAGTTACHLRVNSDSQGQDFFPEVPVKDGDIELVLKEPGKVEGTITWTDETPASGLTVRATGRLSEPPIPVQRMGIRPTTVHDGPVGGDGTYVLKGLSPGLNYDIFVIDSSLGEREASRSPLSPRMLDSFRLEPGEVKVWDHAVEKPITVRGHIRTERTGAPVNEGQVGVLKDGKRLGLVSTWANEDGFFELRLNTGPGDYRFHAEPPAGLPGPEAALDLLAERYGKSLRLETGGTAEVDLTIFEPATVPIRVLDLTGKPVGNIAVVLHAAFPDGRKMTIDTTQVLDEAGRASFTFHFPAPEFWCEIAGDRGGPTVETIHRALVPGAALPEETVVLPRACRLTAVLLDPSGEAWKEQTVFLHVDYEDGSKTDLTGRTDKEGRFEADGGVRAAAFVLEIRSTAHKVLWKSGRIDGSAAEMLDLGRIVLSGADE